MASQRCTVLFGGLTVLFSDGGPAAHPPFRVGGFGYEMSLESLRALQEFLSSRPDLAPCLNGADMSPLIAELNKLGDILAQAKGADMGKIEELKNKIGSSKPGKK